MLCNCRSSFAKQFCHLSLSKLNRILLKLDIDLSRVIIGFIDFFLSLICINYKCFKSPNIFT